jgi:hypothetical protein
LSLPKYHVYVEYAEQEKSGIRFNIGQEELNRTFAEPFKAGQQFWFMGRLLNPFKVKKAVVFWSYEAADKLKLPNGENLVVAKDKVTLIEAVQKSKVKGAYICTEKFLPPSNTAANQSSDNVKRRVFVVSGTDEKMKKATDMCVKIESWLNLEHYELDADIRDIFRDGILLFREYKKILATTRLYEAAQ